MRNYNWVWLKPEHKNYKWWWWIQRHLDALKRGRWDLEIQNRTEEDCEKTRPYGNTASSGAIVCLFNFNDDTLKVTHLELFLKKKTNKQTKSSCWHLDRLFVSVFYVFKWILLNRLGQNVFLAFWWFHVLKTFVVNINTSQASNRPAHRDRSCSVRFHGAHHLNQIVAFKNH